MALVAFEKKKTYAFVAGRGFCAFDINFSHVVGRHWRHLRKKHMPLCRDGVWPLVVGRH